MSGWVRWWRCLFRRSEEKVLNEGDQLLTSPREIQVLLYSYILTTGIAVLLIAMTGVALTGSTDTAKPVAFLSEINRENMPQNFKVGKLNRRTSIEELIR